MPTVIRNHNDPNHATTLNGIPVQREKFIYLPSHQTSLPVLQTSMHFCFRDASRPYGSTLFCTCGAMAIVVGYEAYKDKNAFIGSEVIVCHNYIQYGSHADGSHE